jgi:hypothetical protein
VDPVKAAVDTAATVFGIGAGVRDPAAVVAAAAHFGAAVVGTAPTCTAGVLPPDRLAGASGLRFPAGSIYVAFGISGAPNHLVAADACALVVAVNRDAVAPIAASADVLALADADEVALALAAITEIGSYSTAPLGPTPQSPSGARAELDSDVWRRTWRLLLPRRPVAGCRVLEGPSTEIAGYLHALLRRGGAEHQKRSQ